jgi:3',5'-cyclic AMP phosphodiesterase CpdA
MAGDMRLKDTETSPQIATPFPFVRLRKNVALIGLSSALPQPLHKAGGTLGPVQLGALATALRDLRERGFARVVLIHHPPFPGLAPDRKALTDAAALEAIIREEGADLILHGHNHTAMMTERPTRFGPAFAFGVPSASMAAGHHHPAAWNLYSIIRTGSRWKIEVASRGYDPASGTLRTTAEFPLST